MAVLTQVQVRPVHNLGSISKSIVYNYYLFAKLKQPELFLVQLLFLVTQLSESVSCMSEVLIITSPFTSK